MAHWIIFFSFSSSFYMTPLKPHNGALLAAEGETWGGWKAPALWNTLRERSLLFLHSGWPFGSASTQLTPPPPPLAHSGSLSPSSVTVSPSNGGLEQSEQGQSDSGSRLADDLLAGLESSEPRQLKWSLKLEPTCRGREGGREGGRREPVRERKWKGGGSGEQGACTQLLYGDARTDCVNSTEREYN